MCGKFLRKLLAEESRYSTPVGCLLLPVLLGFRLVLLAAAGPGIYGDDQSAFTCNTQQPGCQVTCYDAFRPLSPLRFWTFQVILLAVPSVLYMGFTLYHVIRHWEESETMMEEKKSLILKGDSTRDVSGAGSPKLLWAYVAQLGTRMVLEGTAMGVQSYLYGFNVPTHFSCRRDPCPFSVDCNLSRPSEKTIFLKAMFGISGLCLLFTLLELMLLGILWRSKKQKSCSSDCFPTSESTRRHVEPTDNFSVATKEQFQEADL